MTPRELINRYWSANTANDRFKRGHARRTWMAVGIAALVHAALFAFAPPLVIAYDGHDEEVIGDVEYLPPVDVEVPPPPSVIDRPPLPSVGEIPVDVPEAGPLPDPVNEPVPPIGVPRVVTEGIRFVPTSLKPTLCDQAAASAIVERLYPRVLKRAGIGGEVLILAHVDENGEVGDVRVLRGSGLQALDDAAAQAVLRFCFHPAMNRDRAISVWVEIPVTFRVR